MASRNRGRVKKTIRDLSREWPSIDERKALVEAMAQTSGHPIVVAILGTAMLEHDLERELRPKLKRHDDETWKKITDENGPLSTLHAKIVAGYAFGIYDETVREALHTVRRIRNVFAHGKRLITFRNDLIIKELSEIDLPKAKRSRLYSDLNFSRRLADVEPQVSFVMLCFGVSNHFGRRALRDAHARSRRLKRRFNKAFGDNPFLTAFAKLTGALPESPEDALPLSLGGHSGGPNPLARGIGGASLLDLAGKPPDKDRK